MNLAAQNGNQVRRSAEIRGEDVGTGKASVRQYFSTTCPALLHSSARSIQTRAAHQPRVPRVFNGQDAQCLVHTRSIYKSNRERSRPGKSASRYEDWICFGCL
jgi:hypothetical protein